MTIGMIEALYHFLTNEREKGYTVANDVEKYHRQHIGNLVRGGYIKSIVKGYYHVTSLGKQMLRQERIIW